MRSSRSVPDPLDPGPAGFAHRGLHHGAGFPENSLLAFAAALELGAGIECDLRLTADDQILVFHDADAWRL
jgi:glycerophosphoryl diester phosphodiesterase